VALRDEGNRKVPTQKPRFSSTGFGTGFGPVPLFGLGVGFQGVVFFTGGFVDADEDGAADADPCGAADEDP
jgi:hypothetical protein